MWPASNWGEGGVALKKRTIAVLFVLLGTMVSAGSAGAGDNESGFRTSQAAMLTPVAPGTSVLPIITVGETLNSGYRFESIPDGISFRTRGQGRVDVYVNHETSTVPFPAGFNDFTNAMLSHLTINQHSAGVLQGRYVIPSEANYQRFCSNYLATEKEGFDRPLLFTNEEATDFVNRTGVAWPPGPGAEQAGVVVAYDPKSNEYRTIYGMGRLNHENSVAVPGYNKPVVLTTDDTFTSNPPQSQLYSYIAPNSSAVWNDTGDLYGFVSDNPAVNDYYDFPVGSSMSVSGTFVKIDKNIARGDQTQLEAESDRLNVFQFVRLEDVAYDKRPGMGNVVYIADTGRGATSAGGNAFTSSNGRIWKLVLDPTDPTKVLSLSILIEGDDAPVKTLNEIHQPDNLETTAKGLYITEDPGSSQQFPHGSTDPNATTARLWRHDLTTGVNTVVVKVDQSADEGPTDEDAATTPGNLGAWESSGIIDVSSVFGPGAFLIDVQAGTLVVEEQQIGGLTYQREGGQLLLLRLPAAIA
jgi:hypothetical protein